MRMICKKCNTQKDASEFYKNRRKVCKACYCESRVKYRLTDYKKRRGLHVERSMRWQRKNPKRAHKLKAEYRERSITELRDWYVRSILRVTTGLANEAITFNMIRAKRKAILLKRSKKETENENG